MTMINEHWGINDLGNGYVNLYSPTMIDWNINSYSDKKSILSKFDLTESFLRKAGYKGWVSWTNLENQHVMLWMRKKKALPYEINIKKKTIWFKREF